jgi:hypothetical protein
MHSHAGAWERGMRVVLFNELNAWELCRSKLELVDALRLYLVPTLPRGNA